MYRDLPRRTIIDQSVDAKGKERGVYTYGIMATVKGTNLWLMVRIRHSSAYSYILHGSYQPVHLPNLLSSITRSEYDSLVAIIQSKSPMETFTEFYKTTFAPNSPASDYACQRLLDVTDDIIGYDGVEDLPQRCNYSFPKGRKTPTEKDPIVAAKREFHEETGVRDEGKLSSDFVEYNTVGHGGRYYAIRCWVMEFDSIIDLSKVEPIDVDEISECAWIEYDVRTEPRALATPYPLAKSMNGEVVRVEREVMHLFREAERKSLLP